MSDNKEKSTVVKLNMSRPIQSLIGDPILDGKEPLTIGKVLAAILANEKGAHFKPIKAWALAQRFFTSDEVALDFDDFENLKKTLEESAAWTPLVIGQIGEYFTSLK